MNKTHGKTGTKLYSIWWGMKQRCFDPKRESYKYYGGKGISVCPAWLEFEGFYNDMADSYVEGFSLERIDNNLDYSKDNCKWIPKSDQPHNRSANRGPDGTSLTKYCAEHGLSYDTIQNRLRRGWDYDKALNTPVRKYKKEGENG